MTTRDLNLCAGSYTYLRLRLNRCKLCKLYTLLTMPRLMPLDLFIIGVLMSLHVGLISLEHCNIFIWMDIIFTLKLLQLHFLFSFMSFCFFHVTCTPSPQKRLGKEMVKQQVFAFTTKFRIYAIGSIIRRVVLA
ncbi:hypothetical protein NMG60_11016641 [Bertholletia excelsa]